MWKFQDVYENLIKALRENKVNPPVVGEAKLPFHFNDIEDEEAFQFHHRTPDGQIERNYYPATEGDEIIISDLHYGEPGVNYTFPPSEAVAKFEKHQAEEQERLKALEWIEKMKREVYEETGIRPEQLQNGEPGYPSHYNAAEANQRSYGNSPTFYQSNNYAQCDKCDSKNVLFYDTRVYDSCPRCKELREVIPEFLTERDMEL
jgi:hypothetical protein